MRDALHKTPIAEKNPGLVINYREAVAIELRRQHFFGQRHADRIAKALPQRTRRRFDTKPGLVFGMARRAGAELPEISNFIDRQRIAGQVQQAVQQHRSVAVRQHEAVTIGPVWIYRIMLVVIIPEDFGDIRHAHRRARMA